MRENVRSWIWAAVLICLLGTGCGREKPLPVRYDGREYGRTAPAKDQGDQGTCWAFASLLALKTALLPDEHLDFSEDHMSHNPNFILKQEDGGEYTMAMAYLLSWMGPVAASEDPYGDGVSPDGLEPLKHVQEIQVLPAQEPDMIKRAVMKYGGVQSSLYTTLQNGGGDSEYYNPETKAYCYPDDTAPNHDVVIVGWDDDFPKEAFRTEVPENGAFLCENSWGTRFGEDGFFYVSYYDRNLGKINTAYTRVEETDNYDSIYQSDLCGWIGQVGYGEESAWAMNVYTAGGKETLDAVGFYAIDRDSDYEVYVVHPVPEHVTELPELTQPAASGHLDYAGYYTVPLSGVERLEAGERFGVVIRITTPGAVHPIAVEYDAGDGKCRIDLGDGEGYISLDGRQWEGLEQRYGCNVCLKAYTSDR
ncbi:MAG: lectin like domain-containing protein [Lachnospiraceae bacterium]|nr:lectin like domain-containing protein [Lachnospiraceae bacterium]